MQPLGNTCYHYGELFFWFALVSIFVSKESLKNPLPLPSIPPSHTPGTTCKQYLGNRNLWQ